MITSLGQDEHPHFKRLPPQGWSYGCYGIAVVELEKKEAKRMLRRRQRDDLDAERTRDVGRLDVLLAEVATGSELLYDGLSASSLDGQPLALAIGAHLACPAIPETAELFHGLFAAAGPDLERVGHTLHQLIEPLQKQAAAKQTAVERSRHFWRTMLDGLPEGCRQPLSSSCCWRRRAYCRHQGPLSLGEPPRQPRLRMR